MGFAGGLQTELSNAKNCFYITTHSQTPIFCIVSRVDKRYLTA